MNERELALGIASGELPSPQVFNSNVYFAARFSGTGCAWRPTAGEFALRDRDIWLAPEMVARVAGVPVVVEHPEGTALDGEHFHNTTIGVCVLGFAKPELGELWCVIRIIDPSVAEVVNGGDFDTSPAVIFGEDNERLQLDDGETLLIEGDPVLLDHLALTVAGGVWSKGATDARPVETTTGGGNG